MSRRINQNAPEETTSGETRGADKPTLVRAAEPQITYDDYPRIEPGEYRAYCRTARIYFDPGFRKWMCLLRWDVLDPEGTRTLARIAKWLYIGRKQHCTRRSQFWREYLRANGGPPERKDRLRSTVFARSRTGEGHQTTSYAERRTATTLCTVLGGGANTQLGNGPHPLSTSVLQSHIPVQPLLSECLN
jgi:hypothetical protein